MSLKIFKNFLRNDSGATLVEYGIALVLAVIVGTVGLIAMAGQINGNLDAAATEIDVE